MDWELWSVVVDGLGERLGERLGEESGFGKVESEGADLGRHTSFDLGGRRRMRL